MSGDAYRCQDEPVGRRSVAVRVGRSCAARQRVHLRDADVVQATSVLAARLYVGDRRRAVPRPRRRHLRLGRRYAPRRTDQAHLPRVRHLREKSQLSGVSRRVRPTVVHWTDRRTTVIWCNQ